MNGCTAPRARLSDAHPSFLARSNLYGNVRVTGAVRVAVPSVAEI